MIDPGRTFLFIGIILVVIGFFISYGPSIPFLGKLPGDIYIKRENFTLYIPITSSILVSLLVSFLFKMFGK